MRQPLLKKYLKTNPHNRVAKMIFKHCSLSGTNDKAGGPHYMLKWASPQVGCKCKSCFAQMQIFFCRNANIVLHKCKYCFAKMQILFCKNANLVLHKCKSCFAQMQILFCTNANIVWKKRQILEICRKFS